jgi:hypothetical protein
MIDPNPVATPSAIMNPPPPTSAQAAKDQMEVLQRVAARDPEAFKEHEKLWRVSHGLPAEKQPAVNTGDVFAEANARALRETKTRADLLRQDGLRDESVYQILNARPIPLWERQWHEQER